MLKVVLLHLISSYKLRYNRFSRSTLPRNNHLQTPHFHFRPPSHFFLTATAARKCRATLLSILTTTKSYHLVRSSSVITMIREAPKLRNRFISLVLQFLAQKLYPLK